MKKWISQEASSNQTTLHGSRRLHLSLSGRENEERTNLIAVFDCFI